MNKKGVLKNAKKTKKGNAKPGKHHRTYNRGGDNNRTSKTNKEINGGEEE